MLAAIAFWYKADSSHKHLYPTAKDENGLSIECTVDGEARLEVCPAGIEIFKKGYARRNFTSPLHSCRKFIACNLFIGCLHNGSLFFGRLQLWREIVSLRTLVFQPVVPIGYETRVHGHPDSVYKH
eukprot:6200700-Pleurochrysis_carterae.AAC.1